MEIKRIDFTSNVECIGIVNFEQFECQKRLLNHYIDNQDDYDNRCVGKAIYQYLNGDLVRTPMISSNCLRNMIWKEKQGVVTASSIIRDENQRYNFMSSSVGLLRGWCFLEGKVNTKLKSPITITDAIANNDLIQFEQCSSGGEKDKKSLFFKEKRPKLNYAFEGVIDLKELGFISSSKNHDRKAFDNSETIEYVKCLNESFDYLAKKYDVQRSEQVVYNSNQSFRISKSDTPESGIYLPELDRKLLIIDFFDSLSNMTRYTNNGLARILNNETKITFVNGTDEYNCNFDLKEIKDFVFKNQIWNRYECVDAPAQDNPEEKKEKKVKDKK